MHSLETAALKSRTAFVCHAAFWYGVLFAAPMLIAASNHQDLHARLPELAAVLFCLFVGATLTGYALSRLPGERSQRQISAVMLAIAMVLAIQSLFIHPLGDFGQFDGSIVDFRKFGGWFWVEWVVFLAAIVLVALAFMRIRQVSRLLAWTPIALFTLLWLPTVFSLQPLNGQSNHFDDQVFEFSSEQNVIHLLPDGLQGDLVEQVFRENPELAGAFSGFTLFTDHLGMYHGTAPAIPTLLTGIPFNFEQGHNYEWITPHIEARSYQNELAEQGFELDLVHIDPAYCISTARSCVSRPFSDWKSRGYMREQPDNLMYSLKLISDLSLYRLTPAYLKEKIHNQGNWLLAGSSMDGASPWPDPVIHEWVDNMFVGTDQPRYKWYHYIGTHKPPFWDSQCQRSETALPRTRAFFLGQAKCVLDGMAKLIRKLESEGIYDQTAIIISADHGSGIAPADMSNDPETISLPAEMVGTARPALLVKPLSARQPLKFDASPTQLSDVAEIALNAASLPELSAPNRSREFNHYSVEELATWSNEPVSFDRYRVAGPVNYESSWVLEDIRAISDAPSSFPVISHGSAAAFMRGARLNPSDPDKELAWVDRRQLAFLLSLPDNPAELVLTFHLPGWIVQQSFRMSVNGAVLGEKIEIRPRDKFWQEVVINLPPQLNREGNDIISIEFESLFQSPEAASLRAAVLLKSITVRQTVKIWP